MTFAHAPWFVGSRAAGSIVCPAEWCVDVACKGWLHLLEGCRRDALLLRKRACRRCVGVRSACNVVETAQG